MTQSIFVYDPTETDEISRTRGVGRYMKLLKENFAGEWVFGLKPENENNNPVTLINPHFDFLKPQMMNKRAFSRHIAVIHDLIPLKYPDAFSVGIRGKFRIFQNKKIIKNYDLIVTDSQTSKKDIVKMLQISDKKIIVIYPTLLNSFSLVNKIDEPLKLPFQLPLKYCLYVGDATWNKNLLDTAKAIKKANVTCIFIGKVFTHNQSLDHPWQKELRDFFQEVRGDKRFLFTGFIADRELIKLYIQSSLNILLSRDEGFGFSFLEAAQFGCPSVLSDIPVFRETAGDSALFSGLSDPTEAANKIEALYFDDNKRQLLSIKAQERAKFFSADKFKSGWKTALLP